MRLEADLRATESELNNRWERGGDDNSINALPWHAVTRRCATH